MTSTSVNGIGKENFFQTPKTNPRKRKKTFPHYSSKTKIHPQSPSILNITMNNSKKRKIIKNATSNNIKTKNASTNNNKQVSVSGTREKNKSICSSKNLRYIVNVHVHIA